MIVSGDDGGGGCEENQFRDNNSKLIYSIGLDIDLRKYEFYYTFLFILLCKSAIYFLVAHFSGGIFFLQFFFLYK